MREHLCNFIMAMIFIIGVALVSCDCAPPLWPLPNLLGVVIIGGFGYLAAGQ